MMYRGFIDRLFPSDFRELPLHSQRNIGKFQRPGTIWLLRSLLCKFTAPGSICQRIRFISAQIILQIILQIATICQFRRN